jgi:hypothetical protein
MARGYKGTIFNSEKQKDAYDNIAIWGKYKMHHDPDSERAEGIKVKNDAYWERVLGPYRHGHTSKEYDIINAISDEDDPDYMRGMMMRKKKSSKPKKRKTKKCKCK